MANIKVVSEFPLFDGMAITFNAPCECSAVDGLTVTYGGESQSFTFRDAHGNDLTGIGNLFSEGAHVKVILDTVNNAAFIQNADTNSYIEDTFVKRNPVYQATPDTLADIISRADEGATVYLLAGNYPLLTFTGEYGLARAETDNPLQGLLLKYPENLTIIGEPGVKIAGISITSGVMDNELTNTTVLEKMRLPGNLTIKSSSANSGSSLTTTDMRITDHLCLRNCILDGLHIEKCYFSLAGINLSPDSFKDYYGADTTSTADTVWHRQWAKPLVSNVIINNNRFVLNDAETETSAMNIRCVNNLDVRSNYVDNAPYTGIVVHGQSNHYSTGRIGIIDNVVKKSGKRGINIAELRDAELFVHTNRLFKQGTADIAPIAISDCVNTKYAFDESGGSPNRNDGATLTVENGGITIENDYPAPENAAPAGYGLGTAPRTFKFSEVDSLRTTGWYFLSEMGSQLGGVYVNFAFCRVMAAGGNFIQEVFPVQTTTKIMRYGYYDSAGELQWGEWRAKDWANLMCTTNFSYSNGTLTITTD